MSAPAILILLPGLAAVLLYFLRRWRGAIYAAGYSMALFLAWLAWQLPIGQAVVLNLGFTTLAVRVSESFSVLGSRFVIDPAIQSALLLVYLAMALWFGGARSARTNRLFVPLGMAVAALLAAALAASSETHTAFLLEIVALLCIPILSPPGHELRRGVLRFLTFQTLGMCFFLFATWYLSVSLPAEGEAVDLLPAAFLLSLAFSLTLSVFPFHTWIPMLAGAANPYPVAFVFHMLPTAIALLLINTLWNNAESGITVLLYPVIRGGGLLMVVAGGLAAAFENQLGRILGFGAMLRIGMALLAISLYANQADDPAQLSIVFAQFIPHGINLALWALALAILRWHNTDLHYRAVRGLARRLPAASFSLVLANFSLAGLPLLACFPVDLALWLALARSAPLAAVLALLGNAGLLAAGVRSLAVLVMDSGGTPWQINEDRQQVFLLVTGILLMFVVGLLPQLYLPALSEVGATLSAPLP